MLILILILLSVHISYGMNHQIGWIVGNNRIPSTISPVLMRKFMHYCYFRSEDYSLDEETQQRVEERIRDNKDAIFVFNVSMPISMCIRNIPFPELSCIEKKGDSVLFEFQERLFNAINLLQTTCHCKTIMFEDRIKDSDSENISVLSKYFRAQFFVLHLKNIIDRESALQKGSVLDVPYTYRQFKLYFTHEGFYDDDQIYRCNNNEEIRVKRILKNYCIVRKRLFKKSEEERDLFIGLPSGPTDIIKNYMCLYNEAVSLYKYASTIYIEEE